MNLTPYQRKVRDLAERAGFPPGTIIEVDALVEFHRLATAPAPMVGIPQVPPDSNPSFDEWKATLPPKSWARYDLSAARLGWEAGYTQAIRDMTPILETGRTLRERLGGLHAWLTRKAKP